MKKFLFALAILLSAFVLRTNYVAASANDFTISSFRADYYLDRDSEGRSTLKTVEAITADFPSIDQNHGIERVIPMKYDNHSTNLQVQSIKDEKGGDVNYSTSTKNDNLVLRIGKADTYVHGKTNYVITYTQHDVTKVFSDTKSDEFYWDVNGTGWSQPFGNVTAALHLGEGLTSALTGNQTCYYGVLNSTNKCTITRDNDVITTTGVGLGVGENVTIAVGFKTGTFNLYKMSLFEKIEKYIVGIELFVASILFVTICLLKILKDKSAPGRGTIVAEYLPPKGIDIALAAIISNNVSRWSAATFVDLAVKHKLQILDGGEEKFWNKTYTLKLISTEGLSAVERSVAEALFGTTLVIGSEYKFKSGNDYWLTSKLKKIYNGVSKQANDEGYYNKNKQLRLIMNIIAFVILFQAILLFVIFISSIYNMTIFFIGVFAFAFGLFVINITKPLSDKGRELADYLKGLKMYIEVAEADRLKILQSPEGADRTPVDTGDTSMVLRLYERVLPYAVLFGLEDDWAKVLGKFYEDQNITPDWYVGSNMFNAALFSSAISGFTTSAAASSTYTSSSSGGSSGGGFSGGGGGGGGGGGW